MKKTFIITILALILAQTMVAQTTASRDSLALENMFDRFFREWIAQNPEAGSQLGLSRAMGYEFDRSRLDDISVAGDRANMDLLNRYLKELKQVNRKNLTRAQRLDSDILEWCLKITLEGYQRGSQGYLVNHLTGTHFQLISQMTDYQQIESRQDADDYLARLEGMPAKLEQAGLKIEEQDKKGIRSPSFIADMVIGTISGFTGAETEQNLLYQDFAGKIRSIPGLDSAGARELRQRAGVILREKVYPAYRKYMERVQAVRARSTEAAGLCNLPGGDKYYRYSLKQYTTLSLDPEEAHRMGLAEVEALQKRGRALLDSLGIRNTGSYGDLMRAYWEYQEKPEIRDRIGYPEGDRGKKMVIKDYQSLIDTAFALLPQAFSYIPKTRVEAQPVPAYKEAGGLTYYEAAPLDGKRKAVFYVNLTYLPDKPGMAPLTFHETVPGHHYQIALQQELGGKRMFRNLFFLSGFGEGWAMYVQDLACELGWLPDIQSRIAEVNSQLFRAVRVVLDTGIHLKKWDRQQARDYMQRNLGWASGNEITRYVVWPGQACSYTLGKIKIKELREKAKKKMGPRFDLKKFHQLVLENGSMPLDILGEKVDDYIKGGI